MKFKVVVSNLLLGGRAGVISAFPDLLLCKFEIKLSPLMSFCLVQLKGERHKSWNLSRYEAAKACSASPYFCSPIYL